MASTQPSIVLRHLRQMVAVQDACAVPDQQFLDRFARQREEAAFEALVRRHGPLVLGVCQRVLHNWHDAEDVFQATFLVLARKAGSIGKQSSISSWLYQVAYHLALKARKQASNRQRRERQTARRDEADPLAEVTGRELLTVFDEELQNLAECERSPLVLCYLEGKTRDEAARLLSCSASTLNRRIERGKDRLRRRLARRGVALSAALLAAGLTQTMASAGVSHALAISTVRAVSASVSGKTAGVASAAATALAEGTLRAMSAAKLKLATAVVLAASLVALGAVALTHAAQAQRSIQTATNAETPPASEDKPRSGPTALLAHKDDVKKLTVTGRILAPDGKPAAGANIAVVARQGVLLSSSEWWSAFRNDIIGQGNTDAEGRFRLIVTRADPLMNVRAVRVIAMKEAVGLAWKAIDPNAEKADVELRLTPMQPVRGRLVGIQGEPAAEVKVHVARITRPPEKGEREEDATLRPPAALSLAAMTNARGEFAFACFGPNVKLELEIKDPRYQRKDEWFVETANKKQCENLQLVLPPGQVVEGRIIYADTRKPVPHARLMIVSPYIIDDRADADGRFRISIFSGPFSKGDVGVHAYAPDGEPYMPASQGVHFDKGVVRRAVEIALPRGVLLRGKITEAGTGKPVAGAIVTYNADSNVRARSGPDGSYQIGGWANAARLTVTHPSGDYLTQVIGSAGGTLDKPIGDPSYYHAIVAVDVKPGDKAKEVNITLRRGVTIAGWLVGPDDKPVASALLFVSSHKPRSEKTMHPIRVRDGKFEVHGCDPEKTYQLLFLEYPRLPPMLMMAEGLQTFGQLWLRELVNGTNRHGASVKVLAKKAAGEPLVVRLAPCGSAKLRFTDADGKPRKDFIPWLQLVVTPGLPLWKAVEDKTLAAEVISLAGPYGDQPPGQPKTDAKGYVTYHGLIPGATYRIKTYNQDMGHNIVLKDFSVESGKTAEVEIVVK
jgi:RNA polymerase sigma factor (sigma-70 family)